MKLEYEQPGHYEASVASSPPLPTSGGRRAQKSRSSSTEPEDVEVGYKVTNHRRRIKTAGRTPASEPLELAEPRKRLGGPLSPGASAAKPGLDRRTACYLRVLRDLELHDETVSGAIAELVNSSLKDVVISSNVIVTSQVPQIVEQLRQNGVSASKCQEVTARLQRAEAKQLARRIAGLFSDQDMLDSVSDALCTELEKTTSAGSLVSTQSRRSASPRAASILTALAGPDSSQDRRAPKRARTAAADSADIVQRACPP